MLMTSEKFWALIHNYDSAIFPVQFVFSIIAIVLLVLIIRKPQDKLNRVINLFLMLCYLWIGVVFFLGFNRELSQQTRYFQPILMTIIALLFGLDVFLKKTDYRFPDSTFHRSIVVFLAAYSIIGYPLIGWLLGHPYSVKIFGTSSIWVPIFGVYPCPTTVLSLGLLSTALPRGNKIVMIPLLLWALFSPCGPPIRNYGAYEDLGLFLAGIYGLIMFIVYFRTRRTTEGKI